MNEGQSLKPREQSLSRDRGTLKSAASGLAGKFRILSMAVLGMTAVAAQACDSDKLNAAEDQCYLDNDPTKPCPLGSGANGTGGTNEGGAGTAGNGNGGTGANEGGSAGNGNGGNGGSGLDGGAGQGGTAGQGGGIDGGAGQGGTAGQGGGIDGGAGQGGTAGQGGGIDGGAGQGGTAGQGGGIDGGAGQGGTAGQGGGIDGGAGAGGDGGGHVGDNCVNHYSCEGDLLCCNQVCVNQTTQNCGECGTVCNGGTPFCIESVGQCTAGCAGQYLDCGDHICRDSYADNMNCGGCGNVCVGSKTCQTGYCKN